MFFLVNLACLFKDEINKKDQDLRRNSQEIEALSFLNTQLKSRLEILQQELNEIEKRTKFKKANTNKISSANSFTDNVLAQELEQKIKQYETIQRRVSNRLIFVFLSL